MEIPNEQVRCLTSNSQLMLTFERIELENSGWAQTKAVEKLVYEMSQSGPV